MADLIDRQAAIDALLHNQEVYSNNFGTDAIDKYTTAIIANDVETIAQLPSAQPRPKVKNVYYEENDHCEFKCSLCGATIGVVEGGTLDGANFKFCPWCGAELDGEVRLWDD